VRVTVSRGNVAGMLKSASPFRRLAGDGGLLDAPRRSRNHSAKRIDDPDSCVRARALRAAGELGRRELVSRFAETLGDDDPMCQFWAAWGGRSAGDRNRAHDSLLDAGLGEHPERLRAFQLALMSMDCGAAHGVLQQLSEGSADPRYLIRAVALRATRVMQVGS